MDYYVLIPGGQAGPFRSYTRAHNALLNHVGVIEAHDRTGHAQPRRVAIHWSDGTWSMDPVMPA
jgi:hypothetical protein